MYYCSGYKRETYWRHKALLIYSQCTLRWYTTGWSQKKNFFNYKQDIFIKRWLYLLQCEGIVLKIKSTHNTLNFRHYFNKFSTILINTCTSQRVSILPKSEMRVSCPMPEITLTMFALLQWFLGQDHRSIISSISITFKIMFNNELSLSYC